jgi:F-type H+-transporting ATPase subunit epsilon
MTEKLFSLELVTPQGIVVSRHVPCLEAPGEEGRLGVLAGHQPYVVGLAPGLLEIQNADSSRETWNTGKGVMTITRAGVTVVVQSAQRSASGGAGR